MRFIKIIKEKLYKKHCALQAIRVRNNFCASRAREQQPPLPETSLDPLTDFVYKNEEWEPIRRLNDVLIAAARHQPLQVQDNECSLSGRGEVRGGSLLIHAVKHPNNWTCFFYKRPLGNCFTFEFDITLHSELKEVQVAFKMKDLANRLRFMIRDNKEAVFEAVKDGWFHKHILTKPYSLQQDKQYHFKITVLGNRYGFYVDNEELLSVRQKTKIRSLGDGLCLILHNENALHDVHCEITNLRITDKRSASLP